MALILTRRDDLGRSDRQGQSRPHPADEQTLLRLALVNNMPDAALEDTESQFVDLLTAAASDVDVELKCYALSRVPRGERAKKHIDGCCFGLSELVSDCFDGAIITGTEPHHTDLRLEPYWDELTQVLDWAEECTSSTVLSCLAAHAAVLHSDGIPRQRLQDKRFGVFFEAKIADDSLTRSITTPICFPHSRWNDLRSDDLTAGGYTVITKSTEAGVGLFLKQKKNSLFVYFQGHPEYAHRTLLKEYRRDIKRFIRNERDTYPPLPEGYFDARGTDLLNAFRAEAIRNPSEELLESFPETCIAATVQKTWHLSSVSIYRNWLKYITDKRVKDNDRLFHAARG
jgi:homoserine O-succinyltransferase